MPPRFLYFDLGNVILNFSIDRMLSQVADTAGVSVETAQGLLFEDGLQRRLETGEMSTREFYDEFCSRTGTAPDFDALCHAASAMFEVNAEIVPVVANLRQAGYPLGILSNTCEAHWQHCLKRYRILTADFSAFALSYEVGAMKPDPAIFNAAVSHAGVPREEVFFTDDLAENVEGAKAAGLDAVHFVGARQLVDELRARGVEFNF